MFTLRLSRTIWPTYQVMKTAVAQSSVRKSNIATCNIYNINPKFESLVVRRLYSDKVESIETVVKKATADNKVLTVDVREPDEVKEHGKIPNSINIPLGTVPAVPSQMPKNEFQKTFNRQKPKTFNRQKPTAEIEIMFYCMIEKRSGKAQESAIKAGYKNTKNYLGSWNDWVCFLIHFLSDINRKFESLGARRLYSDKVGSIETVAMSADYDYVKKATADNKVLIVDVREPDEVKEHGKIPNSINIPLGTVPAVLSQMPENEFQKTFNRQKPTKETEMIFYCMIGKRSGKAQESAIKAGYKNTKNYLGSWNDWASRQAS